MKLFKSIVFSGITMLFIFCKTDEKSQNEISIKINSLYKNKASFYEMKLDTTLFTQELIHKMKNIRYITELDIARIKQSNSPTDKPFLLEGSVFSSLPDGYSKFSIKNITFKENKADVFVEFEYENTPKIIWTDKIILENINGWKIKNIIFSKSNDKTNLLDRLTYKSTTWVK
jgi:hypothetical protein